jgi:hypothetical protein
MNQGVKIYPWPPKLAITMLLNCYQNILMMCLNFHNQCRESNWLLPSRNFQQKLILELSELSWRKSKTSPRTNRYQNFQHHARTSNTPKKIVEQFACVVIVSVCDRQSTKGCTRGGRLYGVVEPRVRCKHTDASLLGRSMSMA